MFHLYKARPNSQRFIQDRSPKSQIEMLTLQIFEAFAIILCIYFLWSRRRFYIMMLKLPGPMGFPFIGLAFEYIRLKRK